MPTLANYEIVDQTGAYVSPTSTYSRSFQIGGRNGGYPAYLEMWAKTGYSNSSTQPATVRLNGTQIGTIYPRPWLNHNYVDLDTIAFPFGGLLLRNWLPWMPVQNILEVVVPPGSTGAEYVILGQVICHYKQDT